MTTGTTQLGKYELLRRLAVGGMAEVFLGRAAGPAGFSKLVAIKRIHLHLVDNPEFVEMFLDEARLAARLDHPNIVQIIDLGHADEHYFLAMEYVQGKTLREVVNRSVELGLLLPLDAIFTISLGVLSALGFAHGRRASTGEPAPIIHRDVSPQNILLSYSGNVKLGDFGIAKAHDCVHVTQDGVIKGKAYYMAPEQMYEGKVSPRVDLYAFGVVLYEMLTGRKLFGKYSQSEMFNPSLRKEVIAPSRVVPARPRELDPVVMRLLERDPERRSPSCGAVVQALEELMLATRQMASTDRLAATMRQLFAPEIAEEESFVAPLPTPRPVPRPGAGERSLTLPPPDAVAPDAPTFIKPGVGLIAPAATSTHAVTDVAVRTEAILDAGRPKPPRASARPAPVEQSSTVQPIAVHAAAPGRRAPWTAIAVGGGLALLAASIGLHAIFATRSPPAHSDVPAALPAHADAAGAGAKVEAIVDARRVVAPSSSPAPDARAAGKPPLPAVRPRVGTLSLSVEPEAEVYLGGKLLGRTPLQRRSLPAGVHTLQLRNRALRLELPLKVTIVAGQQTTRQLKLGSGTLRVNAIPWARVFLDGRMLDVTPIKPLKIPAGQHTVELVYPAPSGEQRHRARITVRDGETVQVIHDFLKSAR